MQLTVLGAGPAYTDRPGATGAAYLLSQGGAALLLDVGHGSFANLARVVEPSGLTAIAISHLHPDHFIDLVALRHYLRYQLRPPGRLTVHAPRALLERLDALLGEPGFASAAFDHVPLDESERSIGPFELLSQRVRHNGDSFGFRVAVDGAAVVYSGDCGRASDLDALVRPGDTLLCEVSFGPGPVPDGAEHLDARAVGDLATRTGAGALLLTHLQMGFSAAETLEIVRDRYAGPAGFVAPGDRLTIGR